MIIYALKFIARIRYNIFMPVYEINTFGRMINTCAKYIVVIILGVFWVN